MSYNYALHSIVAAYAVAFIPHGYYAFVNVAHTGKWGNKS